LINSVLRANRCVAAVLKPLRTTKYARALRSSRLALHPAKRIPQRFLSERKKGKINSFASRFLFFLSSFSIGKN
jgi:hypothetical protein